MNLVGKAIFVVLGVYAASLFLKKGRLARNGGSILLGKITKLSNGKFYELRAKGASDKPLSYAWELESLMQNMR